MLADLIWSVVRWPTPREMSLTIPLACRDADDDGNAMHRADIADASDVLLQIQVGDRVRVLILVSKVPICWAMQAAKGVETPLDLRRQNELRG